MKILHYALGFPPYRTGGLTKFCIDLLKQQNQNGHQTALVWPGRIDFLGRKVSIKSRKLCGIQSFEICNPLPVPYDEGIAQCSFFTENAKEEPYERLLKSFCPDVIHIHTLMGMHSSFLEAARKRKIRCVFTAHDYFPVCPKVVMVRQGRLCLSAKSCSDCGECNKTALPIHQIKILQSVLYRAVKDMPVVYKLRKIHRDGYLGKDMANRNIRVSGMAEDYRKLREYCHSLLKKMDKIHYNSTLTKSVYEKYFQLPNSEVISISHGDIRDCRKKKKFSSERLRLSYLGPQGEAKGFFLLQAALDEWWKTNKQFCLNVYFTPIKPSPYMRPYGRYTYADLETIFDNTDLVIVPSVWQETFGYVVLEALSCGVPVLLSGNVGAKDILAPGAGIVIEDLTAEKLCRVLKNITSEQLAAMNNVILEKQEILTLNQMAEFIETRCYCCKSL